VRPLKLEIKGFTSFREAQEVDFEGLDLFAIVGPTGSGKSSVLDAMTYALFGEVDRVKGSDTPMREIVSQGQPRMAVSLEFEVGDERYRVARSMPRAGATKILLQRSEGADWVQAGEGADRVRDANRMLRELIGLDFDGFTRSVLLPQGKFSAFMSGDAAQRREILTDLLGLSMFERMGRRARAIARESKERADWTEGSISSQFAHATPEALAAAKGAAVDARERQRLLAEAGERVGSALERWKVLAGEARELESCAKEVAGMARAAARHAGALEAIAERAAESEDAVRTAGDAAREAAERAEAARAGRAEAEEAWGTQADLARAVGDATRLTEVRADLARRRATRAKAAELVPGAKDGVGRAEAELAAAREAADRAGAELAAAAASFEEARHADAVAALVGSLRVGDPCPVCGEALSSVPRRPGAAALREAQRAQERARKAEAEAATKANLAERALDAATAAVHAAEREVVAAHEELERCERDHAALEEAVRSVLGDELPADPAAALASRAAELETLVRAEAEAGEVALGADRALQGARGLRERLAAEAATARAGLEAAPLAAMASRAARVASDLAAPAEEPLPPAEELPSLAAAARSRAVALAGYETLLASAATERTTASPRLLTEARDAAGGLVDGAGSLDSIEAIANAVAAAEKAAIGEQERAAARAESIEADLAKVAAMRAETATLRARAGVFRALAQELQADRVMAFLQAEALRLLAVGGSARLSSLSSGRYALAYEGDEFLVVDRWNGDETRSVRTLSGGETFLASLALALALAEQVSSLAVTEHASLDSLFLDEGFGTLDPETLDVVVEAIEQLGGDGRMVGVITHVRDLADRLPARLEVTKSPRGSTVRRTG
jgi:DNA repair protein SbcC/Rad50